MKKFAYILASAAMVVATGCSDSFNANEAAGEGRVILRPTVSTDIKVSRAVAEDEAQRLSESCTIWISSSKGLVRKYDGIQSVPAEGIWLVGGQYVAEAWAGDSVPASFDTRYYKGLERFSIEAGAVQQVDLTCSVANVAVSVKYDEAVDAVLSDYTMTVGHSCGTLTWEGKDDRRGYFMMNSRDKNLTYTLEGIKQDGSKYTQQGTIEAVKPATEYVLNVNYEGVEVETGGAYFTIEVDENTVDIEDEIQITAAPSIVGVYQSLDLPVYGEAGKMSRQGIFVAAVARLQSVVVDAPTLEEFLGIGGSDFDAIAIQETPVGATLEANGVKLMRITDEANDLDNLKITFEAELLNNLPDGEHTITVTATDANGKKGTGVLTIMVSDADVDTESIDPEAPTTWATEATVTGKVMKDGIETVGFNYRAKGESAWQYAEGTVSTRSRAMTKGAEFSAVLTGLKPGTTYEYTAVGGDYVSINVCEFTTEPATQLPNSGFEDWYMDGKIQRISASAADRFWDSGNKGSSTVNVNLTTPCENPKHSGNYSAKLASQKVSIAFAAGNLFVGEFLGTESLTKGILGWGRQWTTRPRALKGYIKYTPAAISDVNGAPSGVSVKVGDQDTGIIYIGIVDDTTMSYSKYSGWPQIVATKNIDSYGFKASDPKVIGYGEKVLTEATPGDGLIEFEIPIDYYRTDVKASNIIVVASASRYGDYYTGGPSVMYLDDLELVY